jgi:hypothetical protein
MSRTCDRLDLYRVRCGDRHEPRARIDLRIGTFVDLPSPILRRIKPSDTSDTLSCFPNALIATRKRKEIRKPVRSVRSTYKSRVFYVKPLTRASGSMSEDGFVVRLF